MRHVCCEIFSEKIVPKFVCSMGNFPWQLYYIGFCISQVKLCMLGSLFFKDTVTRDSKYVVMVSLQAALLL